MLKFLKIIFLAFILNSAFLILNSEKVSAETFSLAISPPLFELMIMPGKSYLQPYTVTNTGTKISITSSITSFSPKDEIGHISLNSSSIINHLPLTIELDNPNIKLNEPFEIDANETKNLNIRITVPANAEEKDYYLTLLLSSQPNISQIGSGSQQAGVLGANLLITVSIDGKPLKQGKIEEFRLSNCYIVKLLHWCLIDSFDKPQYFLRIKNTGRTYWKPVGQITATGTLNQKWSNNLQQDNILANSIREISLATPSAQPNFLIGAYKSTLEFQPDEERDKILKTITFIALPIKLIMGLVLALILLRTILIYSQRRS